MAVNNRTRISGKEILVKILAESTWMIDFFCKNMAASNFCDDRKSIEKVETDSLRGRLF